MKIFKISKISIKLFLITALIFSALLAAALFVQSYYYRKTYVITKQEGALVDYSNLSKDLGVTAANPDETAKMLERYRTGNDMESIIFNNTGAIKYDLTLLKGYSPSPALSEAISIFNEEIFPAAKENYVAGQPVYTNEAYLLGDNERYSIVASNILASGDILLAVSPVSLNGATPGILEGYFITIPLISVAVCMLMSFLFSQLISRPLVSINDAANRMVKLDFSAESDIKGSDELGQLSRSINKLAKTLDQTLNDLMDANKRLQSDINREKKLEASRKEFVSNASHELKTPVAIIKGYSEALKDGIMENKREHYIGQIAKQADHMDKLVRDMLDLSNIENPTYAIKAEEFDICVLIKSIARECAESAALSGVTIVCSSDCGSLKLYADRLKIGQVILNFLDNAIRHTPKNGKVDITLTAVSEKEAKVSVINEGGGIREEDIIRVWERFYRRDLDRNGKSGGTGLGLAISAKILDLHNMAYGVRNAGNGVEFYFII